MNPRQALIERAKKLCREHYGRRERCVEPDDKPSWLDAVAEDYWPGFRDAAAHELREENFPTHLSNTPADGLYQEQKDDTRA